MQINIQEDLALLEEAGVLETLLADRTSGKRMLWATDAYSELGGDYARDREMTLPLITGENAGVIRTRADKAAHEQSARTRQHAEVFTPLWVCRMMNDHLDTEWFGRTGVFFLEDGSPTESVDFRGKSWQRYVDSKRLEIACGEAPYLVSRYDVATGERVPLAERVGILDRKLRAVTANTEDEPEWLRWALRAVQATYGYEFQGDNLLISRVNVVMTFAEHLKERWQREATRAELAGIALAVSWNLWQMDGLTGAIPYARKPQIEDIGFLTMFEEYAQEAQSGCQVRDWTGHRVWEFEDLKRRERRMMRFDYIIGNPPYQEDRQGDSNTATPIYHYFMDQAFQLSERVLLITPARFLFNSGYTSKDWNKERLNDEHFKVETYYPSSADVFPDVDIKGGVAITYRDTNKAFGAIGTFAKYPELNSIMRKVCDFYSFRSMVDIITTSFAYHFTSRLYEENLYLTGRASKGHENDLQSNVFETMPEVFSDDKPETGDEYVRILGRAGNQRVWKWIKRSYVTNVDNLNKYKLFLPKAAGIGKLGEALPNAIDGQPGDGSTITFSSIGSFDTPMESANCSNYLKTKFLRTLLGILKVTQDLTPSKFAYVPLQDFTSTSDIDWTKPIPEIDRQLYAKYGLSDDEIAFIESHVKEMS